MSSPRSPETSARWRRYALLALLAVGLLAALPACAPGVTGMVRATLVSAPDRVRFAPDGSVLDVIVYLSGDGLRLDDPRCRQGDGGWACDLGAARAGAPVDVPVAAGAVRAAAATWSTRSTQVPYQVLTRAVADPEGGTVLPLPANVQALAPRHDANPWAGDPSFTPGDLPADARPWLQAIFDARNGGTKLLEYASSGNLYEVARSMNLEITSLLLAFSQTGDMRILDLVDQAMQLARSQLRDAWLDGRTDGYRGWLYLRKAQEDSRFYGNDTIALDDMLAHGMVAAVTYAYYLNRFRPSPSGVDYNERFTFWVDYLKHDYEAKWRHRSGIASGFPFVEHFLTHPQVGMLRYLYYLGRIGFRDDARQADRLAARMARHFKRVPTSGGPAYVYDHGFSRPYAMAETNYARYTMPMLVELGTLGLRPFDASFLRPFANTVAYLMLNREPFEHAGLLAPDVGGGRSLAGIRRSKDAIDGVRFSSNFFGPFMPFARFDDSGRILEAMRQAAEQDHELVYAAGLVYALTGGR
jgi:hypothetical protein